MSKLDVAPRARGARRRAAEPQGKSLVRRYWDASAVLLLILCSFPTVWVAQRAVTFVPNYGLIDDNWELDSTFKALRGIWIGRDIAFTHGPIFQALSSIPARTMPMSLGAIYATWNIVSIWCAFLFAYIALLLLLPEQSSWKRFVLLLLLASFWETSLRSTYPVLVFALLLRGWYGVWEVRLRSAYLGAGAAVLCGIGFLIAVDVGIYASAAWFICCVAIAVEMRRERLARPLITALAAYVATALVLAIVVNSYMARPLDFKFWRDSLVQVAAYRWATPAAMTREGTAHLLGGLLGCGAIFLVALFSRRSAARQLTRRTGFLLGGFLMGVAVLQSGLVRSDTGHVIIGLFPLIFFTSIILFSFSGKPSLVGALVAIAASMLFSRPVFRPSSVLHQYKQLRAPVTKCPPAYTEFDRACYLEPLTPRMLTAGRSFLQQNSGADDFIFVFPYQTMFGLAADRNVAGGLMQAYTASGPYLSRLEISGLEGKRIPAALYLTDPDYRRMSQADVAEWSRNYLSMPVDGVPNFTRAPEVWFWLLRHYRWSEQLSPGVVGLVRDDSRASRVALQARSLGLPLQTYAIGTRESATNLGVPSVGTSFDFIRLRLTVRYPVWWRVRKPERLQLEITRADGSRDLQWFLAQPNVSSEAWFYPWDGADLGGYFKEDERQWRTSSRSAVTGLRVVATPLDWVSEQPESIRIEAADAVRLELR